MLIKIFLKFFILTLILLVLYAGHFISYSQNQFSTKKITLSVDKLDSVYVLKDKFISSNSLKIYSDTLMLINGKDYLFDTRKNIIKFLPELFTKNDSSGVTRLEISYVVLPYDFEDEYKHRELVVISDTTAGKILKSVEVTNKNYLDEMLGGDVQTSGSLVRGFTFGTNRDLSLNSGFRMQMNGKLSENLDITASLTDENTPIQPEGNTQTLQEVDKVFIELKSKNMNATLGDFNLNLQQGNFARINRRLQGVLGNANFGFGSNESNILLSGAISKGKYHTNYFNGLEGVQGPYRLTGKNNERLIIVIAGTERVYVDGELMKRGDDNDYIIDYSTGEITFAPRRLINGNSRIVVDFEYTDRQYARNFLAASNSISILNNKIAITGSIFYEADDYKNPIDLILNDEEKEILRNAGDERNNTMREAVQLAGKGKGQYIKKDTLIDGNPTSIFIYAPADSNAEYVVSFSYVGENLGDYQKIGAGYFKFVGIKKGNYLPVKFLPLPQQQTLIDFGLKTIPFQNTIISTEVALSNFDANRFSKIDDSDNNGKAISYYIQFNPEKLNVFNYNLGALDFRIGQRFIDNKFNSIDRINEVEYNRKWNLTSNLQQEEKTSEIFLSYKPKSYINLSSNYGNIVKGNNFKSSRFEGAINFNEKSFPLTNYKFELINSKDKLLFEKGNWFRQLLTTEYTYKFINAALKYEMENRELKNYFNDSIKAGSFKFFEYSPRLSLINIFNTNFSVEYKLRRDYQIANRELQRESDTYTQIFSLTTTPVTNLFNSIDLTFRKKNYTPEFKKTSDGNTETILIRWLSRYVHPARAVEADWLYNISTQKSAKLERVFQKVQKGNGSYIYLGDLDSNGIATEDEFRPTRYDGDYILLTVPSEQLYPIIDFKLNWRFKLSLSRILTSDNIASKLLSPFSTETFWRVEEKNSIQDQKKIYLMNFNYFLNENWTILGNNSFQQDIHLFENSELASLRFRFNQRKGLAKYSLASESSYYRERSIRIRWQLIQEVVNIIEYENKTDFLSAEVVSYRVRNIFGNSISSDWIYKPDRRIEIGFKIRLGKLENKQFNINDISNINTQNIRFSYSFNEKGVLRCEFNREEVVFEGIGKMIPYELTEGRIIGKTYLWRVGAEYRITNYIQANFGYDGRKEARYRVMHQMRGEVRAFF